MKNKKLAIEALKKDCEVQKAYWKDGKTCAIGCLGILAGCSVEDLRLANKSSIAYLPDLLCELRKAFDLTINELVNIENLNDDIPDLDERRAIIIDYIKSLPEE